MNKGKIILFFLPLALFFFVACNNPKKKDNLVPIDSLNKEAVLPERPDVSEPKLVCHELAKDSFDIQYFNVMLSVNGKETFIRKVNTCNPILKEEYSRYQIPKEAIDAKGGWYAGGGDYFYLIIRDNQPIVFEGWQEEGQEDDGYHWKEKKLK